MSRPCYEGNDYGDQEYHKLVQLLKESITKPNVLLDYYLLFVGAVWLCVSFHTPEIQGWCWPLYQSDHGEDSDSVSETFRGLDRALHQPLELRLLLHPALHLLQVHRGHHH